MQSAREMLESKELKNLVRRKWIVSVVLTACLFVLYYGIALDKAFLARRIGEHTTLGIPIGAGVIVLSWVLTAAYVLWANNSYDSSVDDLKRQVRK